MSEVNAPKFRYPTASGTLLTLTRTMRFWDDYTETAGGFKESASRTARAGRTIVRDNLLDIVLRLTENERAAVRTMVNWMQDNPMTGFDFWPDVAVAGTVFVCYLVHPVQGETLKFARSQEFTSDLETTLTIRRTNLAAFDLIWHDS